MSIRFIHRPTLLTIVFLGIAALLLAVGVAVHAPNARKGTNIIAAEDLAIRWWVNQQKLAPNKHAVESHGADAWKSTDCYNRNGTWRIYRVGNREFHFLCRDDDGSIRDTIWSRRTNTSREFDMVNAFTPQDYGIEKDVLNWLRRKQAQQASVPNDIILFIDGTAP